MELRLCVGCTHLTNILGITIGAVGATYALHAQRSLNLAR